MGFIPTMLGLSGHSASFDATGTPITQPATINQANQLYGQTQTGLDQQQAFMQALAAQGGIGNQSNVFNALQGVANGTGPNPAMAQLNQATGANVANQAALMAGQRGAGANAGLIARQAAMQGAGLQQQAIGQGASLQANQSLSALSGMGNIANQQVAQQGDAVNAFNKYAQGAQANTLNAIGAQNNANVGMQSNINSANSGIAQVNAGTQGKILNSMATSAMSSGSSAGAAMADGGVVPQPMPESSAIPQGEQPPSDGGKGGGIASAAPLLLALLSNGGNVAPMSSSGPCSKAGQFLTGRVNGELLAARGDKVPGKASVPGDSKKNDTVPAMLSPGEIVIPRSHASDPKMAAAFARSVAMKNRKGKK